MHPAVSRQLERLRDRLSTSTRIMNSLSYERVLDRGFALVTQPDGQAVTSTGQIGSGDSVQIRFKDGHHLAHIGGHDLDGDDMQPPEKSKAETLKPARKPAVKKAKAAAKKTAPPEQGQLF